MAGGDRVIVARFFHFCGGRSRSTPTADANGLNVLICRGCSKCLVPNDAK